jgi:DnaJ-domain-containing protein 1
VLPYFILGIALLVGLILLTKWFATAPPAKIAKALRWTGAILLGALVVFLAVTRQLPAALAALALYVPLFMRWRAAWRRMKSAAGPTPGQSTMAETGMLRMNLDHDTGAMTGEVLGGRFQGRRLEELSLEELVELFTECQGADPQSAAVLEAYLDRAHAPGWREAAAAGPERGGRAGAAGPMAREEAYEILGLEEGASAEEIKAAHRRLMLKLHPDQGGSTYLAAKINQAKDVLLGG